MDRCDLDVANVYPRWRTITTKTATYLETEGIHAEHVRDALWQGADDEADDLPVRTGTRTYPRDE